MGRRSIIIVIIIIIIHTNIIIIITVLISSKIPHTLARVPSAILAAAFRSAVRGGEGVFWG